jgi:hypothetical protein
MDETDRRLTWTQRRELERELWLDDHLRALAETIAKLRQMRGDDLAVEQELVAFRGEIENLG